MAEFLLRVSPVALFINIKMILKVLCKEQRIHHTEFEENVFNICRDMFY